MTFRSPSLPLGPAKQIIMQVGVRLVATLFSLAVGGTLQHAGTNLNNTYHLDCIVTGSWEFFPTFMDRVEQCYALGSHARAS